MAHPDGGKGGTFQTQQTFKEACAGVANRPVQFRSTTGKKTTARLGLTAGGQQTIAFYRQNGGWGGNVCEGCWGFRLSCVGTRIGQWAQALDELLA
jgi:hypothetical protein